VVERIHPCARRRARRGALLSGILLLGVHLEARGATATDWPTYGHDPGGMRYSPLTQINASNVSRLQAAWTYSMRAAGASVSEEPDEASRRASEGAPTTLPRRRNRLGASQATPLVIGGVLYLSTPYRRVVALDADSGREIWR